MHPGEILKEEFMKPLGLSMNKLGLDLRAPVTRIDRSKPRQAAKGGGKDAYAGTSRSLMQPERLRALRSRHLSCGPGGKSVRNSAGLTIRMPR